jgi:hypothetical protein
MTPECNIGGVDRYRLGPLREARDLDVRATRGALASAAALTRATAGDVAGAAGRVAAARAELAAAVRARTTLVDAGASPALIALAERHAHRRRGELDAAIGEELRARAAHAGHLAAEEVVRGRLAIARAERELVERHFARWREGRRKRAERREE